MEKSEEGKPLLEDGVISLPKLSKMTSRSVCQKVYDLDKGEGGRQGQSSMKRGD